MTSIQASGMQRHADFTNKYQQFLTRTALKVLEKEKPAIAGHVKEILQIQEGADFSLPRGERRNRQRGRRKEQYLNLWDGLSDEEKLEVSTAYGKILDLARTARKESALDIMNREHEVERGKSADKMSYTLRTFQSQGLSSAKVQEYIDAMMAAFSITPHPTNPTTVEHTKAGIDLERALHNSQTTPESLEAALKAYLDAPLVGPKKTVAKEVEEGIAIVDNLYDVCLDQRDAVRKALDENGYEDVVIRTPLLEVSGWFAGDGDGNPNATEEALRDAIVKLRERVGQRYIDDLEALREHAPTTVHDALNAMIAELQSDAPYNLDIGAFQQALENLKGKEPSITQGIEDLLYKTQIFGLHYAKLDIRHDAKSLGKTIARIAQAAGLVASENAFDKLPEEQKQAQITAWMEDGDALARIMALQTSDLGTDETGEIAARVFGRLRVIGENPDMSSKLIIAEAKYASDALTALFLLRASGNEVCNDQAKMNIVTLSESVADLEELPHVITKLTQNPVYHQHIDAMGGLIAMIADSDNRRRDGFGAGAKIYDTKGKLLKLSSDLHVPISIMDGGGASLMRGAQVKTTEIPFQHAYLADKYGAFNLYQPYFTVQGHQARQLFSSPESAEYVIEALLSQAVYGKAGVEHGISSLQTFRPDEIMAHTRGMDLKDKLREIARHDADIMHFVARATFHQYVENPAFDELLTQAPWVSTMLANLSSRTNQRGVADTTTGVSVGEYRGNRRALDQRAITGDTLLRFSGLFPLPLLGQLEGLQAMLGQADAENLPKDASAPRAFQFIPDKISATTNTYNNSKSDRNHMRALAVALYMTDFDKAWDVIYGERPRAEDVEVMAQRFVHTDQPGVNSPEVTLAFLEQYALGMAKLTYLAITGQTPEQFRESKSRPFEIKDLLRETWPGLARQMEARAQQLEFAQIINATMTQEYNEHPDMILTEPRVMADRAITASVALNNTPSGMLAVHTAKALDAIPTLAAPSHEMLQAAGNMPLDIPLALTELGAQYGVSNGAVRA